MAELDVTPVPVPSEVSLSRVVIVETIYHQGPGADPESVQSSYSRSLGSDEEPFRRRQKLTNAWEPIETGHVRTASVLHLMHEPPVRQRAPSPQETEDDRRVMEVSMRGDGATDLRVPPGESVRLTGPADLSTIQVCQSSGVGRVRIAVIPE